LDWTDRNGRRRNCSDRVDLASPAGISCGTHGW
jgi:hypothetical protein